MFYEVRSTYNVIKISTSSLRIINYFYPVLTLSFKHTVLTVLIIKSCFWTNDEVLTHRIFL